MTISVVIILGLSVIMVQLHVDIGLMVIQGF